MSWEKCKECHSWTYTCAEWFKSSLNSDVLGFAADSNAGIEIQRPVNTRHSIISDSRQSQIVIRRLFSIFSAEKSTRRIMIFDFDFPLLCRLINLLFHSRMRNGNIQRVFFIKTTLIGIVCYALIEISANRRRKNLRQESHTKLR